MKFILPFFFIAVLFFGCSKDSTLDRFTGTWEFEQFNGMPFNGISQPPGNGRLLVLMENGRFERRMHDTVLHTGIYRITSKPDCYSRDNNIFLSSDDPYIGNGYVDVSNHKLEISSSNCYQDGGVTIYRKIE